MINQLVCLDPGRLTGTVALVTGASSGIGRATALALAAQGATVAVVARRAERLSTLVAELQAAGGRGLAIPADLTSAAAASAAVAAAVAEFGRLDTVVNAAGVMLTGDSVAAPIEHWDRTVDINLRAVMYVVKAALPHLLEAVGSSPRAVADVVNVSSVAGRVVFPQVALYHATKFAVTAATDSWRQEYAARNVRFSVIEPGYVDTELSLQQEDTKAGYDQLARDNELLAADDIAGLIAYVVAAPRRVSINELVVRPTDLP